MKFYTIHPTSESSVTDKFHRRAMPIHYTKHEVLGTGSMGGRSGSIQVLTVFLFTTGYESETEEPLIPGALQGEEKLIL